VHHPIYGYAGRLDRVVCSASRACVDLLDIKTGFDATAGPQTAAHAEAWRA
jgi:hypothetical protein